MDLFSLITLLDSLLEGGTRCEMLLTHNNWHATDRFGSRQVYPDDGNSDDHLFKEGRQFATALLGYGRAERVANGFGGQPLSSHGGRYPAFYTREWTCLITSKPLLSA